MARDPKESRDPREIAGLCKAIPKDNLGKLVIERYGSYRAFESVVGYSQVGEIVKGNRRIANAKLLRAANVLQVSPLYLLDLTHNTKPDADEVGGILAKADSAIKALTDDLAALNDSELASIKIDYFLDPESLERAFDEWRAYGWFQIDSSKSFAALPPTIQNIRGDYRDLDKLARDMLALYPDTLAALLASPPIGSGN